mgnify:CR=1 FL=1
MQRRRKAANLKSGKGGDAVSLEFVIGELGSTLFVLLAGAAGIGMAYEVLEYVSVLL